MVNIHKTYIYTFRYKYLTVSSKTKNNTAKTANLPINRFDIVHFSIQKGIK